MYAHVVASLSKEYAAEVCDLFLHPRLPVRDVESGTHPTNVAERNVSAKPAPVVSPPRRPKSTQVLQHMECLVGDKTMDKNMTG